MKANHPTYLLSAVSAGALALAGAVTPMLAHAAPVENDVVLQAIDDAGVNGDVDVRIDENGVVRLTGLVSEQRDGQLAVDAAESVPGITDVIDRMRTDDD